MVDASRALSRFCLLCANSFLNSSIAAVCACNSVDWFATFLSNALTSIFACARISSSFLNSFSESSCNCLRSRSALDWNNLDRSWPHFTAWTSLCRSMAASWRRLTRALPTARNAWLSVSTSASSLVASDSLAFNHWENLSAKNWCASCSLPRAAGKAGLYEARDAEKFATGESSSACSAAFADARSVPTAAAGKAARNIGNSR
mmetsp:Transcript_39260/g.113473  ORF Transcript_39260/g.113473 Transcript_39260/m.113473 type:complete len:204 (+) Transcript_39260:846-1457(+)